MIKNYFKIAWRNLLKNKVYSFINIFGLAIGMAVTITIGLWIADELSYDSYFKNHDRIAQVYQSQTFNGKVGTGPAIPRPLEMTLRESYGSNFKHISMSSWTQSRYLKYQDNSISRQGNFMQESGLEIFEFNILKGEKNGLKETNSIMLSESTAKALFGDADPLGKIVKVNSSDNMIVTSIYKDIPANTTMSDVDFLMPWKYYANAQEWIKNAIDSWGNNSFQMFVQIADNTTMKGVTEKIIDSKKNANDDTAEFNPQIFLLPMNDWHLRSNFENGVQTGGRIESVWLFGIIGSFVLFLACINFMNLSTARSEKRAMEVGIRKAIGSSREQLIKQFLSESLLVVLFAFVVAIILVLLSLNGFNTLASKQIEFPWSNTNFWRFSLIFVLFTALISGSYPALYLSSFNPVKVLKGTFKAGRYSALPRKVLVVVQFTVSVALIIGTLVVMQQIEYSKNRPVGYDKGGLIQIPTMSRDFSGKYDFMRNQFIASGAAIEMSSSSSPTTQIWSNRGGYDWEGKPEGFQEDFAWTEVSYEYVKSLGMKIIEGRDFSREFASDSTAILINRTAVEYMGLTNPVGKFLRDDDEEDPDPPLKIIGVVEDVISQSPYQPVKQGLYVFDRNQNASYYNLRLNPNKSVAENLKIVEKTFKEHFPNLPFQYDFIDEQYALKFAQEERTASLARVFTMLAIFISCLGLFGLASFVAEQRTKEIGVRKVLGATVANLWTLLSKDFVQLVIISLLIATPVAYYVMKQWIQKFSYRTDISWGIFLTAALGALTITLITVSFQSIKAATANPSKSLRTE
ncbi:ABC-type antimicrobial peptide transport system permease subunit [Flavobacteriaceae bacterium MAR_2010_72]|nr:ABC-type antimicrobial peptide transport system permease subunit [Flavobacteriaceae bacterium MAR_2010_72]TVZ58345.1 ABC-type antimicrobial peptide transport system permease subunit [Flavobacteriaceae bacterium MAR_2010_105]